MSKSTKKKRSPGNAGGGAVQFLIWHGEKFIVAGVVVCALWLAMQGFGYQSLSWTPEALERVADDAKNAIVASERNAEDEELKAFDYAEHAEQIKRPIPAALYRNPPGSEWTPILEPAQRRSELAPDSTEPDSTEPLPESGESAEFEFSLEPEPGE